MMAVSSFPTAPLDLEDDKMHRRQIASSLNQVLVGKQNNVLDVTLAASSATTTLSDQRIGVNTAILLSPTSANASAELAAGGIYFAQASRVNGSAVITHANNSQTDRTFKAVLVG